MPLGDPGYIRENGTGLILILENENPVVHHKLIWDYSWPNHNLYLEVPHASIVFLNVWQTRRK